MICKYIHHVLLLPVLPAFLLFCLFFPFLWSVPEADEKHLSHLQGQGQRQWKRKITCTIPLLTGTSLLIVYVCIMRCRVSSLPFKNRSKAIASIHSSMTILCWFWKYGELIVSQCSSYSESFAGPVVWSMQDQLGLPKSVPQTQSIL